jgi:N6-adenosine-specific RNA methylase IME4
MSYKLIYADPPWRYRDSANSGKRGAKHKYPVMKLEDLKRLPVWDLADEQCLLAMWHVPTMPMEAVELCHAWGFRLMTMKGFTWHKIHAKSGKNCMGMGHLTRGNSEDMLFGVKGKLLERLDAGIIQHVTAPRGQHSEKPAVFRDLLTELVGDVPRIELFARQNIEGWDAWGNECDSDIELIPATFVKRTKENAA